MNEKISDYSKRRSLFTLRSLFSQNFTFLLLDYRISRTIGYVTNHRESKIEGYEFDKTIKRSAILEYRFNRRITFFLSA